MLLFAYFLIISIAPVYTQYASHSLVVLSSYGNHFLPVKASEQLISIGIFNLVSECFDACNSNIRCRIFDYNAIVLQQCRLFKGDTDTLGSIVSSLMTNSIVGTIQLTPFLFTEYGLPCSSSCKEPRYLSFGSNFTCECPFHTYWNPSVGMCQVQSPVLGASCQQDMNMC